MVRYQGDDPILRLEYRVIAVVMVVLVMSIFLVRPPQTHAQFVIAGWDYPDDHGQGINYFTVRENSTGSWGLVKIYYYYDVGAIDWFPNASIKLHCFTRFNNTFMDLVDTNEGKLYQKHTVSVTAPTLGTVFTQENFTYTSVYTGDGPAQWLYEYVVILNFLPVAGLIYTVVVTYEIYSI